MHPLPSPGGSTTSDHLPTQQLSGCFPSVPLSCELDSWCPGLCSLLSYVYCTGTADASSFVWSSVQSNDLTSPACAAASQALGHSSPSTQNTRHKARRVHTYLNRA